MLRMLAAFTQLRGQSWHVHLLVATLAFHHSEFERRKLASYDVVPSLPGLH
jgi:hypothetical protein